MVFDSLQPATAFAFPDLGERGGVALLPDLSKRKETHGRLRRHTGKPLKEGILNCQTCGNAGINLLSVTLNLTGSPPTF